MINLLKKPHKKKASKFQPFKKFFGRRKKREATPDQEDTKLKASSSFGNVCNGLSSDEETNSGLRSPSHSMGTRAFSHESIFIPDGRAESEESLQAMSQENILGKVKTLQQQLAKNIKFGQPSQVTASVKTVGEANASLEADVLLSSPMETDVQQDIAPPESNNKSGGTPDSLSPASLRGTKMEVEDKVTPVKSSSRPKRHHSPSGTIETVNLDAIPLAIARLDNSAAKHKLSVKPKNQRVSKKHRRLSQEMQSDVQQELLEPQLYEDKLSKHDGYHVADKPIQHRESQEQKEAKRKLEHCWRNLETEKKIEMAEAEVKSHTEHKRLQECQREEEGKKQKLQEEEQLLKMEERKNQEGKKSPEKRRHQEFQMQRHKGLEEQRRNEEGLQEPEEQMQQEKGKQYELKKSEQRELEQQRHQELEAQRQLEEQRHQELEAERQLEEQRRRELEAQRQLEEQRHRELEAQRQLEEQRHRELEAQRQLEEQRHRKLEEQRHRELEAQRQLEEQRHRELEAQRQLEEQRHRELEAQRQLEEQRHQELEAQRQLEEQRHRELEAQRQLEEQRHQELEAQRQLEEQRHRELEEQKWQELKHQEEVEEKRHRELEAKQHHKKLFQQGWKDRQEQGKQKWQEEKQGHQKLGQRVEGLEGQMNEDEKQDALKQEVLQVQKRQTDLGQKELEGKRNLDGEESLQGKGRAIKLEQQKQPEELKEKMNKDKQDQQELDKPIKSAAEHKRCEPQPRPEKRMQQEELVEREGGRKLEEQISSSLEGQRPLEKPKEQDKSFQLQLDKTIQLEEQHLESPEQDLPLKEASQQAIKQPDKEQNEEEILRHHQKRNVEAEEQERILGEELRWQEVDARQTMPRGFTFQVSSGEKQIIFPKVNLSPVTPVKEAPTPSAAKELTSPKSNKGSHGPPTSLCVPHTAILVTGAQLCGTAVNLNQIKDTACKSLLGLTEERKTLESRKTSPDAKRRSVKMKYAQEPLGNQAIPAEWASIRSKILKGAENGKRNERDKGSLSRHSDDWTPKGQNASHGNLRKTLSASAKFSITPAWQKFSEISKANASAESKVGLEAENPAKQLGPPTVHSTQETVHNEAGNNLGTPTGNTEIHHEAADNTEGCKFAKDLPSFLVPGISHSLSKEVAQSESAAAAMETQQKVGMRKLDGASPSGEENVSPFGVKLRRTNYSLRFHYDQQAEQKKKKRYSAGDSFDGVPSPLVTPDERDANNMFLKENKSSDVVINSMKNSSANINQNYTTAAPVSLAAISHVSAPSQEKPICKSPLLQKPALAPKPTSQTPPSSPLTKMRRSHISESTGQRVAKTELDATWRKTEAKGSSLLSQAHEGSKGEEEESREKKSFFPSITMPWRERTEKKPEPLKKERPVLQSRHSIDGSKLIEKVETAQPLWITLALQKQKGFREQQATREERRQAREAKQAEKLAKENASSNNQTETKSSIRTSTLPRSAAQEEKKAETPLSRFERREQLKKSNTLPTSVTVEISDSLPPSSLTKEVTKRFSTPEANPVSTEPAWLALAKRKAKAWSDCPQIIK